MASYGTVYLSYRTAELNATVLKTLSSTFLSFHLDGQLIWETEATVDKDKSQPVCIFYGC